MSALMVCSKGQPDKPPKCTPEQTSDFASLGEKPALQGCQGENGMVSRRLLPHVCICVHMRALPSRRPLSHVCTPMHMRALPSVLVHYIHVHTHTMKQPIYNRIGDNLQNHNVTLKPAVSKVTTNSTEKLQEEENV